MILLGGNGYIGGAFKRFLKGQQIPFHSVTRSDFDGSDPNRLVEIIQQTKSEFLINCAGYTGKPNVDACEDDKSECLFGNAVLPGRIDVACEKAGIAWGHISSGCIFSGRRSDGKGFNEEDKPNFSFRTDNCSFYSGTKALGEEALIGSDNVYIWRIRIPFEHRDNPRNYLTKLIRYQKLLEAENSISQLDEFVRAAWDCWRLKVPFGTYNITNPGVITTREVVDLMQKRLNLTKKFEFFDNESQFMDQAAKTPRSNCVMDSSKIQNVGISLMEIHEAIDKALSMWESSGE